MGLFSRKAAVQAPVDLGPDMAVPDPHTRVQPINPNPTSGGYPATPNTYAVHPEPPGPDAGTAVQPQNLAYQTALRAPTYWRGFGRDVTAGPNPNWDLMDDFQRQWATRTAQPSAQDTGLSGYNTDYMPAHAHPGTSHNPDPERPQTTQSTYRETARYDQNWERRLTGRHFSMASNIRTYPIGGLTPTHRLRNTFRLEPPPVDARWTDLPPETVQTVSSQNITSKRTPFRTLW